MTDDLISRAAALKAIDPGHGDFHAGNYNAIAALPAQPVGVRVRPLAAIFDAAQAEEAGEAAARIADLEARLAAAKAGEDALAEVLKDLHVDPSYGCDRPTYIKARAALAAYEARREK